MDGIDDCLRGFKGHHMADAFEEHHLCTGDQVGEFARMEGRCQSIMRTDDDPGGKGHVTEPASEVGDAQSN